MATNFQNVNNIAGISITNLTYGSAWGDFNGDSFLDLWVNNHFDNPGTLYLNQGNGTFTDVTAQVFILDELGREGSSSTDHHGAQWSDFDNDGDQDLLQLVGSATTEPNLLFINDGGVLRDAAPALGLDYPEARAQTPILVDFDNDGLLDLIHTSTKRPDGLTPPTVFRQTSNGFEDVGATVAPAFQLTNSRFGNLADISGDGKLDLLVNGTQFIYDLTSNSFTDITSAFGGGAGGSDAITADFNGDLLSDVYLTRRSRKEQLGQVDANNIRGFFQTNSNEEGAEFNTSGDVTFSFAYIAANQVFIGASGFNPGNINDFTLSPNDPNVQGIAPRSEPGAYIGYDSSSQTWTILNFSPNNSELAIDVSSTTSISGLNAINFNPDPVFPPDLLLINTDQGLVNRTNEAGIGNLRNPGNSVTAGDFDNDMDVDLYIVATGSALNSENVFLDNQGDGTFIPVANAGGAAGSSEGLGDSVTTADYDLDGFLDLFITNGFVEGTPLFGNNGPHQLLRNQGNNNNWLQIDLEGVESNRDGIGAQVFLTAGGVTQLREQSGGIHKWSQNQQRIHFGLAQNTQVDLLEIRWPSGNVQQLENIAANQLISIVEATSTPPNPNTPPQAVDDSALTQQNQAVAIDVLNNDTDADGNSLSLSLSTAPSNGTAVIDDNGTTNNFSDDSIIYTPNTDFTGNDQFIYEVNDGNGGTDTATVFVTVNSSTQGINGTEGRDTLEGTNEADLINGLGNRDVLRGNGGNDTLNGNEGNDRLNGGIDDDVLHGDSGNDLLIGAFGNDTITGGTGSDRFRLIRIDDSIDEITDFNPGEDSLEINGGNFGGGLVDGVLPSSQFVLGTSAVDSNDRFVYDQNTGNFFFDVDGIGGSEQVLLATLSNQANISADNIVIFGGITAPANTPPQAVDDSALTQQNQAIAIDVLNNDTDADGNSLSLSLSTAPSNGTAVVDDNGTTNNFSDDSIIYTPNTDFTGNDQFIYEVNDGNGGTDTATVFVTVNSSSTQGINGTEGRDTLEGTDEADLINGLGERDVLRGNGGNDTLNGNQGNDNLNGGFNDDILNGDSGNDLLIGAFGNDTITGGTGSDRFRLLRIDDSIDEITDFTSGEDTFEFKGNNFGGGLVNGVLPSSQFVLGTSAVESNDRFVYDQSAGNLFFDVDGIGGNEQVLLATLSNQANLSANDIVIF
ncbi:MAG TPA: CRTAC homolog protein [Xenococcaceae cyanobacterium]